MTDLCRSVDVQTPTNRARAVARGRTWPTDADSRRNATAARAYTPRKVSPPNRPVPACRWRSSYRTQPYEYRLWPRVAGGFRASYRPRRGFRRAHGHNPQGRTRPSRWPNSWQPNATSTARRYRCSRPPRPSLRRVWRSSAGTDRGSRTPCR